MNVIEALRENLARRRQRRLTRFPAAPIPKTSSVVTAVLTEENGKTRLTATVIYPSVEVRDMVLETGMARGAGISYDRHEEVAAGVRTRA